MFVSKQSGRIRPPSAFSTRKRSDEPPPPVLTLVPRLPRHTREAYGMAGVEPSLAEVLADPLVHQVMARDGLTAVQVARDLLEAANRLKRRGDGSPKVT
jgi:hypothetical protein